MSKKKPNYARKATLTEESFSAEISVDKEAGVIRGVKILGKVSRNGGRTYSDKALSQASEMYEGMSVNIDHNRANPNAERGLAERFGVLKESRVEADGVYGDLHYLKEHRLAPQLVEMAERMPEKFGLSHNADGMVKRGKGGKAVVESMQKVRSVDIVGDPATTNGLFESEETMTKTFQQMLESLPAGSQKRARGLAWLLEDEAAIGEVPVAELPVAETTGDDDADISDAFNKVAMIAIEDDSLDAVATAARVKEVMKAKEKIMGTAPAKEPPATGSPKDEPVPESVSLRLIALERKNSDHETRDTSRALLESTGREVTDERLAILAALPEQHRQALVEEWLPKLVASPLTGRPLTSPGVLLQESAASPPKDHEAFKQKYATV